MSRRWHVKPIPGGGGHKAAAGFQLSAEDMMEFLKTREML